MTATESVLGPNAQDSINQISTSIGPMAPLFTQYQKPTVYEAWSKVMDEVQGIGKDSRNSQQGFNFRGIDQVMNAVGPVLRRHGVTVIPSASTESSERYETAKGAQMVNRLVKVNYTVYGPGGDSFTGSAYGEAADSGDKGMAKAHSVAYRTFLLQALTIPTDEPDPDSSSHERSHRPTIIADPKVAPQESIALLLSAVERAQESKEGAADWFRKKFKKEIKYGTAEELNQAVDHYTTIAVGKELA